MLKLNRYDARRLLAHQHFTEADLKTVFKRLGSVQFDPLNPVGRNHDGPAGAFVRKVTVSFSRPKLDVLELTLSQVHIYGPNDKWPLMGQKQ